MGELILITGGVRCGKSRYAERLAAEIDGDRVVYVATAEAGDDEMKARIAAHRADRPATWSTMEAPLDVASAIVAASERPESPRAILVDCMTMLVSNLLLEREGGDGARVAGQVDAIREACLQSPATLIVVTNEVGWGVVPAYPLGRRYRDLLGSANQSLAEVATKVLLLVAGIAVDYKALAEATRVTLDSDRRNSP